MTEDDISDFLDSYRKSEEADPSHKWIGTRNQFRIKLVRFFRWLHYPDVEPKKRPKPECIKNIAHQTRREASTLKDTDMWTDEDDALFLKYCPTKRIACYHTISRDTGCRPSEILRLKVGDIKEYDQYAMVPIRSGKTKSSNRDLPLIYSIPYIRKYLANEHPFGSNPNSPLICGTGKSLGKRIQPRAINQIYSKLKKEHFPKLLDDPAVPPEDKLKIKDLLKKPWNPYIRRHSAISGLTEDNLNEAKLKQFAGWALNSNMHQRYQHLSGGAATDAILQLRGVLPKERQKKDYLKPKSCPHCTEPNEPNAKFCNKCQMVLAKDVFYDRIEEQNQTKEQMKLIKNQLETVTFMLEKLYLIGVTSSPKTEEAKRTNRLLTEAYYSYSHMMDLTPKEEAFAFLKGTRLAKKE